MLSEDDTRGIQYLYGAPVHAPPEMTNEIDTDMVRKHINEQNQNYFEALFCSFMVWMVASTFLRPTR